jgi:hypothetical protein
MEQPVNLPRRGHPWALESRQLELGKYGFPRHVTDGEHLMFLR